MSNDADSDWLSPHEPMTPADRHAAMLEHDPGVYLRDSDVDHAQPFADLITATAEPPASPEATVRDAAERCLALCSPDRSGWIFTMLGAKRIEADASRDKYACKRHNFADGDVCSRCDAMRGAA